MEDPIADSQTLAFTHLTAAKSTFANRTVYGEKSETLMRVNPKKIGKMENAKAMMRPKLIRSVATSTLSFRENSKYRTIVEQLINVPVPRKKLLRMEKSSS